MTIHRIVTISRCMLQSNCPRPLGTIKYSTQTNKNRFLTAEATKSSKALKNEKEKFRTYIVQRYIEYVNNYTKALEKRYPTAMRMYRVFSVGIKDFLKDLRKYISLRIRVARDKGFSTMKRQDIELYRKMPSDMFRIAPVLILSAIPFGNYLIFPLAFLKPKALLCSHFWSIQQRVEFSVQDLKERLKNNRPVFRALQAKVDSIPDGEMKKKWRRVVALLGSGLHPTANEVVECKELFTKKPYDVSSLTYNHMGYLLKMHGLRKTIFRRNKLKYCAFLLLEMDKAILREGGVNSLSTESLRYACQIRGLNSSHLSNQDLRNWLHQWMMVSQAADKNSYSLILHCPLLLAYNHPQNWVLIY